MVLCGVVFFRMGHLVERVWVSSRPAAQDKTLRPAECMLMTPVLEVE